jgi:GTP:adenosylcobinamide-phosphate guanylyltransferase
VIEKKVSCLIMAGGKANRLGGIEKGLIELGGTTILEREILALNESDCVSDIYVAVSKNTPKTRHFALPRAGLNVVDTAGHGYVEDSREALKKFSLGVTLILCSDTPFLSGGLIKKAVSEYYEKEKPALSLAIPISSILLHYESKPSDYSLLLEDGSEVLPAGVNIIDGRVVSGDAMIEQTILVVDERLALLNVNAPEDLELARKLAGAESKKEYLWSKVKFG